MKKREREKNRMKHNETKLISNNQKKNPFEIFQYIRSNLLSVEMGKGGKNFLKNLI